MQQEAQFDQLSSTFAALADPTRRAMLMSLADGDKSVSELAQPFEITMPAITKHLKVLEKAGLISRSREAQYRPCRLEAKPLLEVSEWLQQYKRFWENQLDQLDEYLQELQANEAKKQKLKEKKDGRRKK